MAIDPDPVEPGSAPSNSQLNGLVAEAQQYATYAKEEAYGSPLVAATKSAMTNTSRVYVYTGSETGMTAGHWYYYNGSAWTDGGVYNSQGINTDTTLTLSGMAADSKATGDQITGLKSDLSEILAVYYNCADISTFSGANVTVKPNEIIGTGTDLHTASVNSQIDVTSQGRGTYVVSFDAYTEQNSTSTGYGLQVKVDSRVEYCENSWGEWHHVSVTYSINPTKITFSKSEEHTSELQSRI